MVFGGPIEAVAAVDEPAWRALVDGLEFDYERPREKPGCRSSIKGERAAASSRNPFAADHLDRSSGHAPRPQDQLAPVRRAGSKRRRCQPQSFSGLQVCPPHRTAHAGRGRYASSLALLAPAADSPPLMLTPRTPCGHQSAGRRRGRGPDSSRSCHRQCIVYNRPELPLERWAQLMRGRS